jgi:hypothetical protein
VIRAAAAGSLLLTGLGAGCSGDSSGPSTFTGTDADRIAHVEPRTPGMEWPDEGTYDAFSEDVGPTPETGNPVLAEFYEQTKALEYVGDAGGRWETDGNVANLIVEIWATEADARAAMPSYRSAIRAWNRETGAVGVDEDVSDLGDEAFRVGDATRLTYKWRRENLVLEAHVGCLACPLRLDDVLREWVDAVDGEARSDR